MQRRDADAPQPLSDDSGVSEADSIPSRRLKLKKLAHTMTADQSKQLRELKRRAGKKLHDLCRRKQECNRLYLEILVQDVGGVLSLQPPQTRRSNGRFGSHAL